MGVCAAVPAAVPGGQSAKGIRSAGGVQRGALDRENRRAVAVDAERPAAVACGVSADASLARRGLF